MLIYYISVSILIIITSYVVEKYKPNWKHFSVLITILVFISPPIYNALTKEKPQPDFDARIYQYDIREDSVFLKFEIENIGTGDASNIWHITTLSENQSGENLENIKTIGPNEEYAIFSFCRYNNDPKEWMTPVLYLGFDYKFKRKTVTAYKRFDFLITNTRNSGSYAKTNSTKIIPVNSFETLLDSLGGIKKRLSMENGTVFMSFIPSDYYDNPLIAMSSDKRILYNPIDSHIYFERPYDGETMLLISSKIDKNYKRNFHTFLISWSDTSTLVSVDNQDIVTDSIIRKQLATNPAATYRDFGINWFNMGDYFNAITMLEKSLDRDSINHFITYEKLFLCYDSIGLGQKAVEILETAIQNGHLDSSIVLNLAIAFEKSNENEKASRVYSLDNNNSHSLTGFLNHINLHNRLGNYRVSIEIIKMATPIYPNNSKLFNNAGITALCLGDSILALKLFANAVVLDSLNRNASNNHEKLKTEMLR